MRSSQSHNSKTEPNANILVVYYGFICIGIGQHICTIGINRFNVMIELKKWAVSLVLLTALCFVCYMLGRSHSEVKIIKQAKKEIIKEVEVIKYVEKEKAKIWVKPNANRDALLKLMQADQL